MDRATAERQTSREERHRILEQWFPPNQEPRYPGEANAGPRIAETVQIKDDKKNKWREKYIELRRDKLFIFKVSVYYVWLLLHKSCRKSLHGRSSQKM